MEEEPPMQVFQEEEQPIKLNPLKEVSISQTAVERKLKEIYYLKDAEDGQKYYIAER